MRYELCIFSDSRGVVTLGDLLRQISAKKDRFDWYRMFPYVYFGETCHAVSEDDGIIFRYRIAVSYDEKKNMGNFAITHDKFFFDWQQHIVIGGDMPELDLIKQLIEELAIYPARRIYYNLSIKNEWRSSANGLYTFLAS